MPAVGAKGLSHQLTESYNMTEILKAVRPAYTKPPNSQRLMFVDMRRL